jgi:hypothetical protein
MWLLWLVSGWAWAGLPVDTAVLVLFRVLSYDRALDERQSGPIRFGIVYDRSDPLSVVQAEDTLAAAMAFEGTVSGFPLETPAMLPTSSDPWDDRLAGISVLIVCRGAGEAFPSLIAAADQRDIPILSLDAQLVGQGASVGVEQRLARLELVVDLVAARKQGMELGGELLELSRVVAGR